MQISRPLHVHTYPKQVGTQTGGPRHLCGSTADGASSSQIGDRAPQVATSHTHAHMVAAVFAHADWVTPEMAHTVSKYAMAMATPVPSAMDPQTDNVDLMEDEEMETCTDEHAAEMTLDVTAAVRRCNQQEWSSHKRE